MTSDAARIQRAKELGAKGEYRTAVIELKKVLQNDANNKDARLLLGEISLSTGQIFEAEKELRRAYELGVPFDRVAISLGQTLLLQRNYDAVLDEFDPSAVDNDALKAGFLMLRGDAYIATGKLPDAERIFREVLVLEPDSIDGRVGLAKTALVVGDFDGADAYLKDALSIGPFSFVAWVTKGRLEFQRKRYAEAEDAFINAIENGEPRPNALQEFIARNGLAEAQWRQGRSEAALKNVEQLMRLAPRQPRPRYLRALIAYGAGDYETTVQHLQQILRSFPDYRPAQVLLGAAHYTQGNLEQADMYLSSVLAAEPSNVRARKMLAATRLRQHKPSEAMAMLQPAITQDGSDRQLLGLASQAAFEAGDVDEGVLYLEQGLSSDPDNQALQMDLAWGYLTSGELDQAIEILEKLPETKEGAYRREVLLILAYLRKGDTASAFAEGQKLLANHPNDSIVHSLVGSIYMAAGQLPKARQHFEKALQLQPQNVAALMNLGRLDLREGRQDAARERFEQILTISPKNVNAMLALAQLAAIRGDQVQSGEWLERASEANPQATRPGLFLFRHYLVRRDLEKAHRVATNLVKHHPKNGDVYNALGVVEMANHQYPKAATSFRKAIELSPRSADIHYNLARAELAQQNFGEAKRVLAKTLELQPNHLKAASTLAKLEMRDGKAKQALGRARKLQENQKTRAAGYVLEGDLRMMQRQYTNAVVAYDKAARQADTAVIAIKSYRARRQAKMPDAVKPLTQWLKKKPDDARVRLVLAEDYRQRGQVEQAVAEYQSLLGTDPNNAVALNNLAWLYHEEQDSRARETAERAHELQPQAGVITDTLGWILVQQGQTERGLDLLREAVKQSPNVPAIRYHLAVALARSGAKDEARKTLTELVNSGENFKEIAQAKKLLQEL